MIELGLWDAARQLQEFLDACGYPFCFIGGISLQRWGEPRLTEVLDATIVVEFGEEGSVVAALIKRYQSRVPDPMQFAIQARIVLVQDIHGFRIDVSLGGMPFERRMIDRATNWQALGNGNIRTCSAEDLVILKSFASRPQDWIDVEKVIIRQQNLDRDLIIHELSPLAQLKEEPEIVQHLQSLFSKH